MKKVLFVLLLLSISFSAIPIPGPDYGVPLAEPQPSWQLFTGYAILLSALILIVLFMLGTAFDIQELKLVAHEEMYQIIMTMVLAAVLVGAQEYMSVLSKGFLDGGVSIQSGANQILTVTEVQLKIIYTTSLMQIAETVGNEGAKSAFCNFMSTGVNISACGGYRALGTPISTVYQLMGVILAEIQSMKILLNLGTQAFVLFIPLGIFLRAFKLTRGAGALFLGFGIALYFIFPLSIVFVDKLLVESYSIYSNSNLYAIPPQPQLFPCDEWNTGEGNMTKSMDIFDGLIPYLQSVLSMMFLRGIFVPVISLMITVASLRALTAIGGAEIDVSVLSKIA